MNNINEAELLILEAKRLLDDTDNQEAFKAQHDLNSALNTLEHAEEVRPDNRLVLAY